MGAGAAWIVAGRADGAQLASVYEEIERRHGESVARLQEWIRQPSIAAENRGVEEGCELTMRLLSRGRIPARRAPCHRRPARLSSRRSMPVPAARSASISCTTSSRPTPRNGPRRPGTRAWSNARPRARGHGPRRGQPEGTAGRIPGRSACDSRRGPEAAGQPRAGGRGRRGNRLAAFRAGGPRVTRCTRHSRSARASSCRKLRRDATAP